MFYVFGLLELMYVNVLILLGSRLVCGRGGRTIVNDSRTG